MSKPLAYSYIRFSSEKQSQGDSLRRQLKLATDYATQHGLILDDHSYRDLGVSAFKSKNANEGKLSAFIQAVDAGVIRPGSYLLIESLDRLSRADVDIALELFLSIIRRGIVIVTLADNGALYSTEKIKADKGMSLIMSILVMIRANEESVTKSNRVKAGWAKKALEGEIMTKVCPAWMKLVDGKFELIEERVDIVKRMFDLYINGRGSPYIAKLLNSEGIKPFGWAEYWTNGTVASILNNPATYGTLRRKKAEKEPIPKYYPAAISEDTFLQANSAAAVRKWVGGKRGVTVANLFSGMSYCGHCGSKMRVVSTQKTGTFLKCLKAFNTDGCKADRVSVKRVEETVMNRLWNTQARMLILDRVAPVVDPTAVLRTDLIEKQARVSNLIKLASMTNDLDAVAKEINLLQTSIERLQTKIKNTHVEKALTNEDLNETQAAMIALEKGGISDEERTDLRIKLQAGMRRILTKVAMYTDPAKVTLTFASGNVRDLPLVEIERFRVNGTFAKKTNA